ncbi:MAG: type II toxin-antitoxin system RelE/ParE family toxin [candidate division WWE3 bacterium]|nr:type II toxin-antitoxin system RelE/ParE family toxin [candidate division WWE3 bacterium]
MYSLLIHREALKFLDRLNPSQRKRIAKAIDSLAQEPFPKGKKIKKLKSSPSGFRFRVGDFRILYTVNTKRKEVFIYKIAFRASAY